MSALTHTLRLRERALELRPGAPAVMGIVNASPESLVESGATLDGQVAIARTMLNAGATLIDVGGESGASDRPPVTAAEEIARVRPLIERLVTEGALVSVDTWKAEVADAALGAGAVMVNDPSGLSEPRLAESCARHRAALVVTHTRVPPKRKSFPGYADVGDDVTALLRERIGLALERGIQEDRLVVDPGPDLGKTPAETVAALRALRSIHSLGRPVLLAVSRKDFVGALTGRPPAGRLAGTLAAVGEGVDAGASLLRVHDVPEVCDFLRVRAALRGEIVPPPELRLSAGLRRDPVGG